jgi:hypothetical protein
MCHRSCSAALILKYLPDFCWQSWNEIVTMFEVIDEDISISCLRATIFRLQCNGQIEHRRDPRMRKSGF